MKKTLLLLSIFLLAIPSFAQKKEIKTVKQLTDSIQVIMQEEHIVGLTLGITTKDSVLFQGGLGYADLEAKRPVDEKTLFRLGSITKMFVAVGIRQLAQEGKLKLDDELKKIAPEVPFQNAWEATHPVRVIHLLEHTSGFDDIKLNRMYTNDNTVEYQGIEQMLAHKPSLVCRWKAGERYAYSNPNYVVLGYLIQKFSGKNYAKYLKENLLDSLGMTHSNFNPNSKFPQIDTKEYIYKNGKNTQIQSVTLIGGAQGALWSCAEDMNKFIQFFLKNGSPFFPPQVIEEIETPRTSLGARAGLKSGYGLGNHIAYTRGKSSWRGHSGLLGVCYSGCYYSRDLGVGFMISSNSNNLNYRIEGLIFSYLEQNTPDKKLVMQAIDTEAIAPFLGYYQFESPRNEIAAFSEKLQNLPQLYLKNNKLYLKPLTGSPTELVQTGNLIFAWKDTNIGSIAFVKGENGKNIMTMGGVYFEQTNAFFALSKRIIIVLAAIFMLSSFILGLVSFIRVIMGKLAWRDLIWHILPMFGVSALAWAVVELLDMQANSYRLAELTTINFTTLRIFLGTTIFGLVSVIILAFASHKLFKNRTSLFAWYFWIMGLSFCLIAFMLWQNDWIGLRTWAM